MLVFSGLTQTKEEPCADKRLRSFLTETVYNILIELSNRRTLQQHVSLRVKIILLAFQKLRNCEIARQLSVERHCVGRWRERWSQSTDALLAMEMRESRAQLERGVIDVLSDAHRSGSRGRFSAQQIAEIVSTACEDPSTIGRPVPTWTGHELADEAIKRQIVSAISVSQVNYFLRLVNLQPHRQKYWCFTTEKDHAAFRIQAEHICSVYLNAQSALKYHNTRTICVDEMTSLAANERRAVKKLAFPGNVAKVECQYHRHGTLSLTGSWDVALGQMIRTTIDETRNDNDFAQHIRNTVATDPSANWIFVCDNLNTHYGEAVTRTVAELLDIDQATLGDKNRRCGVLGSMASRREFLSDFTHRIRFAYTPKHSSWLNQIEVIFGILARRVIRPGSFKSKQDLKEKLTNFIDYYNRTFAKPLNWTYTGRPTQRLRDERPRSWREKTQSRKAEQILALVAQ